MFLEGVWLFLVLCQLFGRSLVVLAVSAVSGRSVVVLAVSIVVISAVSGRSFGVLAVSRSLAVWCLFLEVKGQGVYFLWTLNSISNSPAAWLED